MGFWVIEDGGNGAAKESSAGGVDERKKLMDGHF